MESQFETNTEEIKESTNANKAEVARAKDSVAETKEKISAMEKEAEDQFYQVTDDFSSKTAGIVDGVNANWQKILPKIVKYRDSRLKRLQDKSEAFRKNIATEFSKFDADTNAIISKLEQKSEKAEKQIAEQRVSSRELEATIGKSEAALTGFGEKPIADLDQVYVDAQMARSVKMMEFQEKMSGEFASRQSAAVENLPQLPSFSSPTKPTATGHAPLEIHDHV